MSCAVYSRQPLINPLSTSLPLQLDDYLARAKRWRQEQLPLLWSKSAKAKEQKAAKAKAKGGKG